MSPEPFGPHALPDFRRWLWASVQSGGDLEILVKDAPPWAAPVVETARRRQANIEAHQRVLTGVIDCSFVKEDHQAALARLRARHHKKEVHA